MEPNILATLEQCIQENKQHIKLSPPIEKITIEKFEQEYHIILPKDYKIFLTYISNGCTNDYFEPPILSFAKTIELVSDKTFLNKEYTQDKKWIIESDYPKEDASDKEITIFNDKLESTEYGVLTIAQSGEDTYQIVVNGKLHGNIIYRNGVGISPLFLHNQPISFLKWFEYWCKEDLKALL